MGLNIKKVLQKAAEEQARVKPLPTIRVKAAPVKSTPMIDLVDVPAHIKEEVDQQFADIEKKHLISELTAELAAMKRQRGKLSTQTAHLVLEIENKLKAQNPAMAAEFMKGNLPMPELAEHYAAIEAHTDRGAVIHRKLDYVERYGMLPGEPTVKIELKGSESPDVSAIKYQIRRLDDLIYKKSKNLEKVNTGIKTPKNTGRPAHWREIIALAEAQRDDLKQQLKRKHHEHREQRLGSA